MIISNEKSRVKKTPSVKIESEKDAASKTREQSRVKKTPSVKDRE
jgi:hypothetical protein